MRWVNTEVRHLKWCQCYMAQIRNDDIKEWGWWWHWCFGRLSPEVHRSPLLSQTALDSAKWPTVQILVKNVLTFLPTNLLEFLLQCKLVLWKTGCPELVRMTEIFIGFFLFNTKALISDDNILILIFLIKFEKDSALDLMTKSLSFLIQMYFPQMW